MTINRKYIFDKVCWHLKKETKFFTSNDLNLLIGVDAFRQIAMEIRYPKTVVSSIMSSGQWTIDMPADFLKIDETDDIVYQNGTSGLIKITPRTRKLIGRDMILTVAPGIPTNYFMETETSLGVYPPSTSGTIVVPYVRRPTSLSSDTATNELTEMTYQAAVYWCVTQCLLMDDDERYLVYQKLYDMEIARLNRQYGDMYEEEKDFVPDENYTGGR